MLRKIFKIIIVLITAIILLVCVWFEIEYRKHLDFHEKYTQPLKPAFSYSESFREVAWASVGGDTKTQTSSLYAWSFTKPLLTLLIHERLEKPPSAMLCQLVARQFRFRDYAQREGAHLISVEFSAMVYLSRNWSHTDIIDKYIDGSYFGRRAYGAHNASKAYLNKEISELSVEEFAMLCALSNSPSAFAPERNPDKLLYETNQILLQTHPDKVLSELPKMLNKRK